MRYEPGTASAPYAGFAIRAVAAIIDAVIVVGVTFPMLFAIYGMEYWESDALVQGVPDFIISWVLPIIYTFAFWLTVAATPGKMVLGLKIIDATSGEQISSVQSVIRYIGYYVSLVVLFVGYIWVAFDRRKQGWHDKMANTVVVRPTVS